MVVCFGPGPLDLWTPRRTFAHFWLVLFFCFFLTVRPEGTSRPLVSICFFRWCAQLSSSFLLFFFCFAAVHLAFSVSPANDLILLLLYAVHFECDGIESKFSTRKCLRRPGMAGDSVRPIL